MSREFHAALGASLLAAVAVGAQEIPPAARLERFLAAAQSDPEGAAAELVRGGKVPVPALLDHLSNAAAAIERLTSTLQEIDAAEWSDASERDAAVAEARQELERTSRAASALCLALGEVRDARSLPALCDLLSCTEETVAGQASRAFVATNAPGRLDLLTQAFRLRPTTLIATTLGALHSDVGAAACLSTLTILYQQHEAVEQRQALIEGVVAVNDPAARELLRRLAGQGDTLALAAIARFIDRTDGEAELTVILSALEEGDPWARATAAAAVGRVGKWGYPRVVAALLPALQCGDERVERHAVATLQKLTFQRFGRDTARWEEWWATNEAAVKARAEEASR